MSTAAVESAATGGSAPPPSDRAALLRHGLRLESVTVGWNVVEGVAAVGAALAAGSVALLGFGVDSFVESASGSVLIWRLHAERHLADHDAVEATERRAQKLVASSLFLLAGYIALDALTSLAAGERPVASPLGVGLTSVSLAVMWWLARAKRRVAAALGSRAMAADAFQTAACWWLSLIVLGGLGANALFGWWWADPAAALGMCVFLVREGAESWRGESCEC